MQLQRLRYICLALALPLALGATGCKRSEEREGTEATAQGAYTSSSDTAHESDVETVGENTGADSAINMYGDGWYTASMSEQIMADDDDWIFTGRNTKLYFGSYAGCDTDGGEFTLINRHFYNDEKNCVMEFELYTPDNASPEYDKSENTLFAALRVQYETSTLSDGDGLWLGFKKDELAIANAADGDDIKTYKLPYSFSEGFRRVRIEDDKRSGTVSLSLEDDSGKLNEVYRLSVGSEVRLYSYTDGFTEPIAVLSTEGDISPDGQIKLFCNGRGGVYIKNVACKK